MLLRYIFKLNYWDYVFCNLFCIVFDIEFYLNNKSPVPISFLSNHQRSRILPRSRPSCFRPFRSYILTILNWWTLSKNNKQYKRHNRCWKQYNKDNNICSRKHNIISGGDSIVIIHALFFICPSQYSCSRFVLKSWHSFISSAFRLRTFCKMNSYVLFICA